MKQVRIFVYGTLKRRFSNHHLISKCNYLGEAETIDKYPMVVTKSSYYPYLLLNKGIGNYIQGELYCITNSTLHILDQLENYPNHYDRKFIDIQTEDNNIEKALIYFLKTPINIKNLELLNSFNVTNFYVVETYLPIKKEFEKVFYQGKKGLLVSVLDIKLIDFSKTELFYRIFGETELSKLLNQKRIKLQDRDGFKIEAINVKFSFFDKVKKRFK